MGKRVKVTNRWVIRGQPVQLLPHNKNNVVLVDTFWHHTTEQTSLYVQVTSNENTVP